MTTLRIHKSKNYFAVSNVPFRDTRLSWEARGLMGYLLSKPDDWKTRIADLVNQGPAGEKRIVRILAELRKYGYLSRRKIQLPDGRFEWETDIFEVPEMSAIPPSRGDGTIPPSATDGSTTDGGRRYIASTESPSTESRSTDSAAAAAAGKEGDDLNSPFEKYPAEAVKRAFEKARRKQAKDRNAYALATLEAWEREGKLQDRPKRGSNKARNTETNDEVLARVASEVDKFTRQPWRAYKDETA